MINYRSASAGTPFLWQIPELDGAAEPDAASAPSVGSIAIDVCPIAEQGAASLDEPSVSALVEVQIATGYDEGWQRGLAEGKEQGYAEGIDAGSKAADCGAGPKAGGDRRTA